MHKHWSITSSLQENFRLYSISATQFVTVDRSFSGYSWSPEAMTTGRRVLIPVYEMSAKETKGFVKCFDANVQTWVIIIQAEQVHGVLKSHLQRHGSCLHRLDKSAKVSLRKSWWQTAQNLGEHISRNWVSYFLGFRYWAQSLLDARSHGCLTMPVTISRPAPKWRVLQKNSSGGSHCRANLNRASSKSTILYLME